MKKKYGKKANGATIPPTVRLANGLTGTDGVSTSQYRWATGASFIQKEDAYGNLEVTKHWLLGDCIGAEPSSGNYRYYLQDRINSTRSVVDDAKSFTAQSEFSPFGSVDYKNGEDSTTGYANHDPIGSLYTTRYRIYSPHIARWLTKDPIGITKTFNLYTYVENSPIQNTDVLGLLSWDPRGTCRGHRKAIKSAFKEICDVVNGKCSRFASCVNQHEMFRNANVVENFKGYCSNTDSITVNCADSDPNCEGGTHAYVPRGTQKIVMCPYGLSNGKEVAPLRCVIAHELAHVSRVGREDGADAIMQCVFPDC